MSRAQSPMLPRASQRQTPPPLPCAEGSVSITFLGEAAPGFECGWCVCVWREKKDRPSRDLFWQRRIEKCFCFTSMAARTPVINGDGGGRPCANCTLQSQDQTLCTAPIVIIQTRRWWCSHQMKRPQQEVPTSWFQFQA